MTQLLSALHTNTLTDDVRHMAAVILRRLFSSEFQEFYTAVSVQVQLLVFLCVYFYDLYAFRIFHIKKNEFNLRS